jgi:CHAT domain-containing protein
MAVLAAWYRAETGLARLLNAEAEAQALVKGWSGLPLAGSAMSMRQLLTGTLKNGFENVGGVEAVHFAGHGDFDPTKPDASALFLEDGTPLSSTMFRAAQYGGARQPLLFLNGCMLGIGGDLLGDMAGFPGNSLRGGFGAVIGALWEIDDAVAHDIALAFWKQALPPTPSAAGIAVGQILRDLRANYMPDAAATPVPTYLAYVYYGHPRLVLQRATPQTATAARGTS